MRLTKRIVFVLLLALPTAAGVQPLRHSAIDPEAIAAAQNCPNWCWAAGAEMLLRSQGVYIPQEQLVARVFGPNLPCRPGQLPNVAEAFCAAAGIPTAR